MPKNDAMKILQVCKKYPYPLKDGESIAIHNLSKALVRAGAQVDLLAMNTARHPYTGQETPEALAHYTRVLTTKVDNRIRPLDAFRNLFSTDSYHIVRFVSEAFAQKLIQTLQTEMYDIIQLETVFLAPYIPVLRKHTDAKISMRAHNLEHEIWERITRNTRAGLKRWYLHHLTKKLKRFEVEALQQYNLLIAITQRDLDAFRRLGFDREGIVTPIGLDMEDYEVPAVGKNGLFSISFIGSLDWMPNVEGLRWFLDSVWPLIHQRFPNVQFHVAGRNSPQWLRTNDRAGIIREGEVPDAVKFISHHPIMIVPLLSGSGMRAKILEGMALGKVVLTTTLGLEGIDAVPGKEVLVADQPEEFLDWMERLQHDPVLLRQIGARAKERVAESYESSQIGARLLQKYQNVLVDAVP